MPILFSVFFIPMSHGQFLKKLTKRVEQKVENTVVEKTANKATEKTSKSMDKVFDANPFVGGASGEKADPSSVANSYDFTWKYSLKMTRKEGEILFDYYLKPDASYFGFTSATMKNMFTVMDNGHKITVMFMKSEGNTMGMVSKMPDDLDLEEAAEESANYKLEQLEDKTINGYHCKGVKAVSDDYEMVMYFTNDTEVSFEDLYKNQKTKIPLQLTNYFKPGDKVLMVSMDMNDLKNKKRSAKMECVGLEKVTKTVNKSDYKFVNQ